MCFTTLLSNPITLSQTLLDQESHHLPTTPDAGQDPHQISTTAIIVLHIILHLSPIIKSQDTLTTHQTFMDTTHLHPQPTKTGDTSNKKLISPPASKVSKFQYST